MNNKPKIVVFYSDGRAVNIKEEIDTFYRLLDHFWIEMAGAGSSSGTPEKLFVNGNLVLEGLWDTAWKFGHRRKELNDLTHLTLLKEFPQPWEVKK